MTLFRKRIDLIFIYIFLHFSFSFASSTTWHYFNSYDYYIGYNKASSYADAKADCLNEQATLVVIKTKEVQDFLDKILIGTSFNFFIGLERINPGKNGFRWIDSTNVSDGYTNWWSNEPNNNWKQCVVMRNKHRNGYVWFDSYCNVNLRYICRRSTANYKCGTNGRPCVFPFTYLSVNYNACTTVDHSKLWCSFDAEYKGNLGICAPCQKEHKCGTSGRPCKFPFEYLNVIHNSCATIHNNNIPWCSFDEEFQNRWENCAPCPEQTTQTALPDTIQTEHMSSDAKRSTQTTLVVTKQTEYRTSDANFNTTISDVEVLTNASDNDQQSNVNTTTIFNSNNSYPNKRNLAPTTTIILIVIGSVLLLLLIILFFVVFYRRRRNFKCASAPSSDNTGHSENLYEVAGQPTQEVVTNVIYNADADANIYETPIVPDSKIEVKNPIYHPMETTNKGIPSSVSSKKKVKNEKKSKKISSDSSKYRYNSNYENSYDFAI